MSGQRSELFHLDATPHLSVIDEDTANLDSSSHKWRKFAGAFQGDTVQVLVLNPIVPRGIESSQRSADHDVSPVEIHLGCLQRREAGLDGCWVTATEKCDCDDEAVDKLDGMSPSTLSGHISQRGQRINF